jgi:beta-barrel assembly-enhancing protease
MKKSKNSAIMAGLLAVVLIAQTACNRGGGGSMQAPPGSKSQPKFQPGFNLFSPEQDVQLGMQSAQQVLRETPMVPENHPVTAYVRQLGAKLASKAAGEKFQYKFWVVATKEINAFALPGGFLFINAGTIAAAKNEGELAGVVAHEIAHSALRHGTNQASKAKLAQGGLGVLAAIAGAGDSPELGQVVGQIGGLGANMLFLKYGRNAEKQADLEGARMLAEAGYDPRDMANFFKTLEAQGGQRMPEMLSDHPDPGNRIKYILAEIPQLPVASQPVHNTNEFEQAKAYITGRAPQQLNLSDQSQLKRRGPEDPTDLEPGQRPPRPAGQFKGYQAKDGSFAVQVPANWDALEAGPATLIFAPRGAYGKFQDSFVVTHGLFVGMVNTQGGDLASATAALIQRQIEENADYRVVRQPQPINFGGQQGYVAAIAGPSAHTGVVEVDVTYTAVGPNGQLFYLTTIVPEDEQGAYKAAFEQILRTVQLAR